MAAVVDPGVVDLDDVRVNQAGNRQCLAAKAGNKLVVVGEVLGEDFHRDGAFEHPVEGLVDGRHAAGTEAIAQLVAVGDGADGTHFDSSRPTPTPPEPAPPLLPPVPWLPPAPPGSVG